MSILYVKIRLLVFLFCMGFSSFISAEKTSDLLSLYNEALRHDALLSAATLQNKATQELIDQGLSLLLPNISAQGVILISTIQGNLIHQSVMNYCLGIKQIIKIMNMALWLGNQFLITPPIAATNKI